MLIIDFKTYSNFRDVKNVEKKGYLRISEIYLKMYSLNNYSNKVLNTESLKLTCIHSQ